MFNSVCNFSKGPQKNLMAMLPSGKLTWLAGKSPFFIREYIFNGGPFSIVMLVYQRVIPQKG